MASFTDIPTASLAPDKYVTYDLLTALRDNTLATVWHPYNKTTIGDANTGLFYDFAVHGTQANITTPDFEDGYDYMVIVSELSHNGGATPYLEVQLYQETSAAYTSAQAADNGTSSLEPANGQIIFPWARTSRTGHVFQMTMARGNYSDMPHRGVTVSPAQKILRARLAYSSGSIDAGKAYLYRRGVFSAA